MLIFVLFTINGCEQEEIFNKTTIEKSNLKLIIIDSQQLALNTSLIKELNKVKQLNTTNFLRSIDEETFNFRVNTDKAKYIEKGDKHSYTFSITRNNSDGNMENLVFTLNKEGGYNAVLVKYDFTDEQYLKITKEGFSLRKVIYTPINYDYKDLVKKNNNRSAGWGCSESWEVIAVISPRNFVVTHYEWVLASSNCSFYSNYDVSGQEDIAGGNLDMYTSPMEENSGGGSGGESTSLELEDDKIIIDPSFENSKANCIYEKLKQLSTSFANAIKKFDGEFPVAHLQFKLEDLDDNTRGITEPPLNYVITITLNNDNSVNGINYRPNLLTAKTLIHEVIHAEMFRKLISISNTNGNIDVSLITQMLHQGNYPGMLDYYTRYGINGFQHQQMAQHYRETIARILQEYDTGFVVPSSQFPLQLYMDLAWEGLNHSDLIAWQNVISKTERDRIDAVIEDYIVNNKNGICQ